LARYCIAQKKCSCKKRDGTPRKLVDTTKINGLGWQAGISLREGIKSTYLWFLENEA